MFASSVISAYATVRYVNIANLNPTPPYTDWSAAATNIQDAVDASAVGDQILVTNGVYYTGGRRSIDGTTNRVAVTNAITVQSVNGVAVTSIDGGHTVRCVYLADGAVLSGFSLINGNANEGGGVRGASANATVTNCVFAGNLAQDYGGGAYLGTIKSCVFSNNSSFYGGGESGAICYGCVFVANLAQSGGGGWNGTVNNCTIVSNSTAAGDPRGGFSDGKCNNCIVYYNVPGNFSPSGFWTNTCTSPLAPGDGNFTNAPGFVNLAAGDLHLLTNSPCINAGKNAYVATATDFDGNPRIVGGTVDVGVYEFQTPVSLISYAWLQRYGLPADPSVNFADPDGDGMNNWQEWICGTDPTNALSLLKMSPPTPSGSDLIVSWQSVTNRSYFVRRATDLAAQPAFSIVATNIAGKFGNTTIRDFNAAGRGPFFYQVGVQH